MVRKVLVGVFLSLFLMTLGGCSRKEVAPPPPPPKPEVKEPVEPPEPPKMHKMTQEDPILSRSLQDLNEMGLLKDIFFDFNKYNIREDQWPRLQEDIQVLKKYPNFRILIEGHCDERGSNEYNMALGWKRANTVRDALIQAGISPSRIETISYGEERPFETCHNETCWSKNRRAHFVIIGK